MIHHTPSISVNPNCKLKNKIQDIVDAMRGHPNRKVTRETSLFIISFSEPQALDAEE
jgi:hypothetical protein